MPRPKPLVRLHGAVDFDKLVPFDSKASSPPLANNDILVMRRAAGGDNLTLSISDINATGSVNIAQLVGGVNNDMLYRVGGVWTGTGGVGLNFDGSELNLVGPDMTISGGTLSLDSGAEMGFEGGPGIGMEDGAGISIEGAGSIEVTGTGNIEQTGTGNIEISGGGSIMVTGGSKIEIEDAGGQIIITSGENESILLEGDSSIFFDGDGGIVLDGDGDIELDSGRVQAGARTAASPSFTWPGDTNTGFFNTDEDDRIRVSVAGIERFLWEGNEFKSLLGSGPAMLNVGASGSVPVFIPNQADMGTGFTRSGLDQLSHVGNNVETLRVRASTAVVAAHSNLLLWDYDNAGLTFLEFGAANSAGAGFKTVRVVN